MAAGNFHINTDYPMDKVIFLREITLTPGSNGTFDTTIAHGLGAIPFCKGVATTDGWQTTFQSGSQQLADSGQYYKKRFQIFSNASNIRIYGWMADTAAGEAVKPVTVRIWGVFNEAATLNVEVPPTRDTSSNEFIINSDYNYPRLFAEGIANVAVNGSTAANHNLGYVPMTDIWCYDSSEGGWCEIASQDCFATITSYGYNISNHSVVVDASKITFINDNQTARFTQFYYRIYL